MKSNEIIMRTITLEARSMHRTFDRLHQQIGGELQQELNEITLTLDNALGKGKIKGLFFKGGITYLEFDLHINEKVALVTPVGELPPLCFAYCSKGNIKHRFSSRPDQITTLDKFQTGVLTNRANEENILHFSAEDPVKFSLILINRSTAEGSNQSDLLNRALIAKFIGNTPSENRVFVSSYNLKVAEKMQQLASIKETGIVRSLLIEGIVHLMLAYEIKQHAIDSTNADRNMGSLTRSELQRVSELSELINKQPQKQYTVKSLCLQSGLSPTKLQNGFRLMHDTTVNNYIKQVRVKLAEHLLTTTDMNVSEVVYSIGFTSRSYFSKIFRAKYQCSPREYKMNQQVYMKTA